MVSQEKFDTDDWQHTCEQQHENADGHDPVKAAIHAGMALELRTLGGWPGLFGQKSHDKQMNDDRRTRQRQHDPQQIPGHTQQNFPAPDVFSYFDDIHGRLLDAQRALDEIFHHRRLELVVVEWLGALAGEACGTFGGGFVSGFADHGSFYRGEATWYALYRTADEPNVLDTAAVDLEGAGDTYQGEIPDVAIGYLLKVVVGVCPGRREFDVGKNVSVPESAVIWVMLTAGPIKKSSAAMRRTLEPF